MGCLDFIYGEGITAVEWAEKAADIFKGERIDIFIERLGDTERSFSLRAIGKTPGEILQALQKI